MTISAAYAPPIYTGTGAGTALTTVFTFFAASEVVVTSIVTATGVETVLTKDVEYTLTGGGVSGTQASSVGTVTPKTPYATTFPSTVHWRIERNIAVTQATDYISNAAFPAISHEGALDKLTMLFQQELSSRPVLLDEASATAGATISVTSNNWPVLYDSVRLELLGISPGTVGSDLLVKIVDNGSAVVTGLNWVGRTITSSGVSLTEGTGEALQNDATYGLEVAANQALFGELIANRIGLFLNGRCEFTYTNELTTSPTIFLGGFARTTAATRLDGFELSMSAGTITGKARLWGLPRK